MDEKQVLQEQINTLQSQLNSMETAEQEQEQAENQKAIDDAIAEGYEGVPPPGEWSQSPEAEIQFEGVKVETVE